MIKYIVFLLGMHLFTMLHVAESCANPRQEQSCQPHPVPHLLRPFLHFGLIGHVTLSCLLLSSSLLHELLPPLHNLLTAAFFNKLNNHFLEKERLSDENLRRRSPKAGNFFFHTKKATSKKAKEQANKFIDIGAAAQLSMLSLGLSLDARKGWKQGLLSEEFIQKIGLGKGLKPIDQKNDVREANFAERPASDKFGLNFDNHPFMPKTTTRTSLLTSFATSAFGGIGSHVVAYPRDAPEISDSGSRKGVGELAKKYGWVPSQPPKAIRKRRRKIEVAFSQHVSQ